MCFGFLKALSRRDGSFEYPQHMFGSEIRKIIFSYALLSGDLNTVFELCHEISNNVVCETNKAFASRLKIL